MTDNTRNKNIHQLVDKFFEGETTLHEEQKLYDYFNGSEVDDDMMPYRDMMIELGVLATMPHPIAEKHNKKRSPIVRYVAIAATIAGIIFGMKVLIDTQTERKLQALYGGSYIIENGKRTDDLKKIKREIEETLAWADKVDRQVETNHMMEETEQDLLNSIDNPLMKSEIQNLLTN